MIADGVIDILFVNESELATLTGEDDFEAGSGYRFGQGAGAGRPPRSEKGAVAHRPWGARRGGRGAGDQGDRHHPAQAISSRRVSVGLCQGRGADPLPETPGGGAPPIRRFGSGIAHYGPRPEADMQALMAEWL